MMASMCVWCWIVPITPRAYTMHHYDNPSKPVSTHAEYTAPVQIQLSSNLKVWLEETHENRQFWLTIWAMHTKMYLLWRLQMPGFRSRPIASIQFPRWCFSQNLLLSGSHMHTHPYTDRSHTHTQVISSSVGFISIRQTIHFVLFCNKLLFGTVSVMRKTQINYAKHNKA